MRLAERCDLPWLSGAPWCLLTPVQLMLETSNAINIIHMQLEIWEQLVEHTQNHGPCVLTEINKPWTLLLCKAHLSTLNSTLTFRATQLVYLNTTFNSYA